MTSLDTEQKAKDAWPALLSSVVGPERVTAGARAQELIAQTASMSSPRSVPVLVRPEHPAQVAAILSHAGAQACAVPVHAFSTGRSWGMGSRLPAVGPVTALDLSDLRQIREVDTERGFAVIEPGVSQMELSTALAGTDRMINVTVSSAHTSFIGNMLDRGVGLRHQRTEDVLGLEVALPSGDLVRLGWWPENGRAAVYRHGLGPDLLSAFVQSNLGVVTAAVIKLLPRPEASRLIQFGVPARSLEPAMEEVRRWVTQGMASGVVKVYNPAAAVPYGAKSESYLVHVVVDGVAAYVDAVSDVLVRRARESELFDDVDLAANAARTPQQRDVDAQVQASYLGELDASDRLFTAKMGVAVPDIDTSVGFLMFLPLIPFRGSDIRAVSDLIREADRAQCGVTFNAIDDDVIDCVVTVRFERTPESRQVAHEVLGQLVADLAQRGYQPYRLGIDQAEDFPKLVHPNVRELVEKVRKAIDPTGVIAPGRYA